MSFRNVCSLGLALAIVAPVAITQAEAAKPRRINLEQGEQKVLAMSGKVVRVATADPKVVGANVVEPKGVVLTALGPGSSWVSIWEEGKSMPSAQYQVVVSLSNLMSSESLGSDKGNLKIDSTGVNLRLSGELSSLERHQSVVASATPPNENSGGFGQSSSNKKSSVVDASKSAFDVQVQLDVKIVEVSRSKVKSSGFYSDRWNGSALTGISGPGNLSGFQGSYSDGTATKLSSTGFVPRTDAFNIFRWGANSLTVFSALESNGFAYVLAEPSLTALSGQTATFLAGGEIPMPVRSGSGADSSVTIYWREFGIRLGMTPTVLDSNRMAIKVAPEVSELDSTLGITTGGFTLPGLRVRRTETMVAAGDGETFVISGLVSQESKADIDKFPFLGDIPILGAFFRSNRFDRTDKELLMIVTPHLVRPFAKEAKLPPLPGQEIKDYDPGYLRFLFLENGSFTQPDTGFSR